MPRSVPFTLRDLCVVATAVALATYVVEAPLRYGLAARGLEALLYLRDGLLLLAPAYVVVVTVLRRTRVFPAVAVAALGFFLLVGLVQLDARQAAFGAKIFVPLLAGIAVAPWFDAARSGTRMRWFVSLLWLTAVAGVAADAYIDLPWAGISYKVMGVEVEGSRVWAMGEFSRLSGFARASYEAAGHLLVLGFALAFTLQRASMRAVVLSLTGAGILMTTTKGLFMAFVAAVALALTSRRLPFLSRGLLATVAALCIGLPLLGVQQSVQLRGEWASMLLGSMLDRMLNTWPDAFQQFLEHSWLLGGGLGAIGVPQSYFLPSHYNPADNLFVYLLALFGLPGVLGLLFFIRRLWLLCVEGSRSALYFVLGGAVVTAGVSMSVLESGWLAFVVGVLVSRVTEGAAPALYPATESAARTARGGQVARLGVG